MLKTIIQAQKDAKDHVERLTGSTYRLLHAESMNVAYGVRIFSAYRPVIDWVLNFWNAAGNEEGEKHG